MARNPRTADDDEESELRTVRDYLRYAVSRFTAADLAYGHGTDNAFDEAAFLVLETLRLPIDRLDPFLDARLLIEERRRLADVIEARVTTRKPAAYLVGRAYVQGIPIAVDERVIVPRSYIGEILLSDLIGDDDFSLIDDPQAVESVLDLCTGSGVLAIIAAMRFPNARVDATDLSADALAVAEPNLAAHHLADRISLFEGDLFKPIASRRYDLILANPPYVAAEEMAELPPEYRHEPAMALASGRDGLDCVRRILSEASRHLNPAGGLLCEVGTGRLILEAEYPDLPWFWVETEASSGEVFWFAAEALTAIPAQKPARREPMARPARRKR